MFSTSYSNSSSSSYISSSTGYGSHHQYSAYEPSHSSTSSSAGSGRYYDGESMSSGYSSLHNSSLPRRNRTSSLARPLPVGPLGGLSPDLDSSPYVSRKLTGSYGYSGSSRTYQPASKSFYTSTTSTTPRRFGSSTDVRLSLARELNHYDDNKSSPHSISVIYQPSESTNSRLTSSTRQSLSDSRSRPNYSVASKVERINSNLPPTGKSTVIRTIEDRRITNGIDRRPTNSSSFDSGLSYSSFDKAESKPPPLSSRSSSLYDYSRPTNGGEILQVATLTRSRSRQNGFVDDSGDEVMSSPPTDRVANGRIIIDRIENGDQRDYDLFSSGNIRVGAKKVDSVGKSGILLQPAEFIDEDPQLLSLSSLSTNKRRVLPPEPQFPTLANLEITSKASGDEDYNRESSSSSLSSQRNDNDKDKSGKQGKVGLKNLGNTCFMNSVIQCLSHTRPLKSYCLASTDYSTDINNNTSSRMKGALMKAFCNLLEKLWETRSADSSVNPDSFKTQLQKFAPRFTGYSQQDSQEFLRYLLQGLHEDINRVRGKPPPASEIDDKLADDRKAAENWKRYLRIDDSKIVDTFVGQLKSELRCTHCCHVSVTFDPFWDLSLPIPNGNSFRSSVSLNECFDVFTKEENLDGDERPVCEVCKTRRKCTKRFTMQKLPNILVLHLKRFTGDRYRSRLSTLVDFPVKGLDLAKYMACAKNISNGSSTTYNLYAVSNHTGTPSFGHYTAYCKHAATGQWLLFDDTKVSAVNERSVVSSEAYVLFYEMAS